MTGITALGNRCGFQPIAPAVIRSSAQMNGLCPSSAVLMSRPVGARITPPVGAPITSPTKEKIMKLDVYDPALCCSSGVCGPDVDPALVAFAADLLWVAEQGVSVTRYNLGQQPQAFAANPAIVKELEAGIDRLPILVLDGQILSTGIYPTRGQLAAKLALSPSPAPAAAGSCCSPRSGCC
ncbi:arsenite efflux transporter metallochaperone ArsD [Rhodospirillum rubrum]|uniref:Arsenical resistance operon trans-acting repressor ArsD n=1 Tax=Rhodospirillum rubrum (strain ATCC 11170 / ATH 1.1.1 / DSM 467 / LMG 4362 / NCIMB 8255 / S1) TaxID=269796 RepID=Q2RUE6_RHORT|nr:arsenite efflux transporter metallochaperone ArsD [Rhodospirillum rubrum]ABC22249.1 Arsenical resistance operon trans-acting repressor ArsD [Rhodospirillum rubrum ATCC 11170]MBK5953815.1 arsenical resistance operon transcriptional repressor ArsD [Rhodospirillum rubrum]HAP99459.1 arsenical resistance operon transcriptional repressor ArsD [Rhodospirillum rubrum]HCF18344.1 arsenical resistance operon transcriptional repressor ArsD [Rhodospirillum rubrum]